MADETIVGNEGTQVESEQPKPETVEAVNPPSVEDLQNSLKKFEGVDVERWAKVKDVDPVKYAELQKLAETIEANPEVKKNIDKLLAGDTSVEAQLKALSDKVDAMSNKEVQEANKQQFDKFLNETNAAMDNFLKEKGFELITADKDGKGFDEKKWVIDNVIQTFIKDTDEAEAKGLAKGNLDWKDVPKVVADVLTNLELYRRALSSKLVRTDVPPNVDGNVAQPGKQQGPLSESDRISKVAEELRASNNSRNANII
jgi:hypothetical protein